MGRGTYSWSRYRGGGGTRGTGGNRGRLNPIDVDQYDGWTLQQIEDRIRGLNHEELFAVDKDGKVIEAYQGNKNSVAFPMTLLLKDGITVTHGHPLGAEGYGGTFSFQDVLNMAASNWAEHRAAASGKGEMNYIIRRNSKTTAQDGHDLYNRIQRDKSDIQRQIREAASRAGDNLTPNRRRQIYTGVLDRYWAQVLPEYNFEYIKRKEPYRYNR